MKLVISYDKLNNTLYVDWSENARNGIVHPVRSGLCQRVTDDGEYTGIMIEHLTFYEDIDYTIDTDDKTIARTQQHGSDIVQITVEEANQRRTMLGLPPRGL